MRALVLCSLLLVGFAVPGHAPVETGSDGYGFQFVRIRYNSSRGWTWAYDYPTAEETL